MWNCCTTLWCEGKPFVSIHLNKPCLRRSSKKALAATAASSCQAEDSKIVSCVWAMQSAANCCDNIFLRFYFRLATPLIVCICLRVPITLSVATDLWETAVTCCHHRCLSCPRLSEAATCAEAWQERRQVHLAMAGKLARQAKEQHRLLLNPARLGSAVFYAFGSFGMMAIHQRKHHSAPFRSDSWRTTFSAHVCPRPRNHTSVVVPS